MKNEFTVSLVVMKFWGKQERSFKMLCKGLATKCGMLTWHLPKWNEV